jgi:hypothetical protein
MTLGKITWLDDTLLGFVPTDKVVCLRDRHDPPTITTVTADCAVDMLRSHEKLRQECEDLRAFSRLASNEWLVGALEELESRANEAGSLRGEDRRGGIMWGMALAYRDAAAHIRSFLPKENARHG